MFKGIESQTWKRRRNGDIEVLVSEIGNIRPLTIRKENAFICMDGRDCEVIKLEVEMDQVKLFRQTIIGIQLLGLETLSEGRQI